MTKSFDETPAGFQEKLIAACDGDIGRARENYEIVAKDGWAPAYLDAYHQNSLKLPPLKEQPVSALTRENRSLAESIVEHALDAR